MHVHLSRTRTFFGLMLFKGVWSEVFFLGNTKTAIESCLLSVRILSVGMGKLSPLFLNHPLPINVGLSRLCFTARVECSCNIPQHGIYGTLVRVWTRGVDSVSVVYLSRVLADNCVRCACKTQHGEQTQRSVMRTCLEFKQVSKQHEPTFWLASECHSALTAVVRLRWASRHQRGWRTESKVDELLLSFSFGLASLNPKGYGLRDPRRFLCDYDGSRVQPVIENH